MARHLQWQWLAPLGPAPDSYSLYKGLAAGAEVLYRAGLTSLSYSDPEATPGSTYFGYVTATTGGIEASPTNEASVTVPVRDLGGPMSETHLFSTGTLAASFMVPFTASRGLNGAVATPGTGPLSALSDTTAVPTAAVKSDSAGAATNYEYFIIDLGVPRLISSLTLLNVTLAGATHSVLITASSVLSTVGVPAGTVIPATPTGPLAAVTVTATPASPVLARYLYIQDTNSGALAGALLTLGEVLVTQSVPLAVLQDVSFGAAFSRHDLFDSRQVSAFAIDTADHEGKWTVKAGNASFTAASVQMLIASVLSTVAGASVNKVSGKIAFPALQVQLNLQDTLGNLVTVVSTFAKAQGDQIGLKLTDFAVQNFELHCYPDPVTKVVAVITYF